jgi:hypothetical protein
MNKSLIINVIVDLMNEEKKANKLKSELFSLLAIKTNKILTTNDF